MAPSPLSALVIATSSGVPMRSERPKPIHMLCGRPMLSYVLDSVEKVGVHHATVVTGPSGERVSKRILDDPPLVPLAWVEQRLDRGQADAAQIGLTGFDDFDDDADVLVLPADLPLLRSETLRALVDSHRSSGVACTVLSAMVDDPGGQDRVIRDRHGKVVAVRRAVDLEAADLQAVDSDEVDTGRSEIALGVYCIRRALLAPAARRAKADIDGLQRMSSVVEVIAESGHPVGSAPVVDDLSDLRPVDDRRLLAEAERVLRRRINLAWLDRGVTMVDPERTYIDVTVELGTDVTLFPGTILQGTTSISNGCEIGPDTRLDRCIVGPNSVVEKTMARLATIGSDCRVGPFAVLEPGGEVHDGTVTGPFYAAKAGD